jgi:hypothetical protein
VPTYVSLLRGIDNTFFERRLGVAATTRNWKTLGRLVELVAR